MRKLIYSIGVTMFLAFLTFHVTTSLTNPFYGVSMEALAQGSGSDGSDGEDCTWSQTCSGGICSVLNAKKRFFNGCKKKCDYTCTVQGLPDIP